MFLYGIGIQYGRQFVAGLTGAAGRRANLLARLGLAAGVVMALASIGAGLPTTYVTGLFAGAMTSTAALQAAIEGVGLAGPCRRLQCGLPDRRDRTDPVHVPLSGPAASQGRGTRPAGPAAMPRSARFGHGGAQVPEPAIGGAGVRGRTVGRGHVGRGDAGEACSPAAPGQPTGGDRTGTSTGAQPSAKE